MNLIMSIIKITVKVKLNKIVQLLIFRLFKSFQVLCLFKFQCSDLCLLVLDSLCYVLYLGCILFESVTSGLVLKIRCTWWCSSYSGLNVSHIS